MQVRFLLLTIVTEVFQGIPDFLEANAGVTSDRFVLHLGLRKRARQACLSHK